MTTTSRAGRTVGEVAALARVTVRALHHWDEIGLLRPSGRTWAGYRLYDEADLARLQRLLLYREVGLPLEQVGALLDDPDADPVAHLRRQREQLLGQVARLEDLVAAVDTMLEEETVGRGLTSEERFELFGDWLPQEYEAEAAERWGDTDAWAQSRARTTRWGADEWRVVKAESDDVEHELAEAMADGVPPEGARARAAAERHRAHVGRFYDCPPSMHRALAQMWVDDPRFRAHFEAVAPGLAQYAHDAVVAAADAGAAQG